MLSDCPSTGEGRYPFPTPLWRPFRPRPGPSSSPPPLPRSCFLLPCLPYCPPPNLPNINPSCLALLKELAHCAHQAACKHRGLRGLKCHVDDILSHFVDALSSEKAAISNLAYKSGPLVGARLLLPEKFVPPHQSLGCAVAMSPIATVTLTYALQRRCKFQSVLTLPENKLGQSRKAI